MGHHVMIAALCATAWLSWAGCADRADEGRDELVAAVALVASPLSVVDCEQSTDTGYVRGSAYTITVVHVDGKPVEVETANAYDVMARAADRDGVTLGIVSGFRTWAEQYRLGQCYLNCNCNGCRRVVGGTRRGRVGQS